MLGCSPGECALSGSPPTTTISLSTSPLFAALIIILFLISTLIFAIIIKRQKSRLRKTISVTILLASYALIAFFFGLIDLRLKKLAEKINPSSKVPANIKAGVDKYIINEVGLNEFQKNYRINYDASENCNEIVYGCYLRYDFKPAVKYGGSEYLFYYSTKGKVTKHNKFPLPSCEKDANNCEFQLTLEEIKEIARKEKLNSQYFPLVMYNGKVVIEISYCNLETTENRRKILVDPKTGEILWRGRNSECEGII